MNSATSDKRRKIPSDRHEPLAVRAARLIRADIMTGKFHLGEHLVETELAATYQVRRHVVREALQVLEGEGLVESDAFCGRSVFHPDSRHVRGLLLLRVCLETSVAALAAYRMTAEAARGLREAAGVPESGFADASALYEWDVQIHRAIWRVADQPLLVAELERAIFPFVILTPKLAAQEEDQAETIRRQLRTEREPGDPSSHATLIAAVCSGDSGRARLAMAAHLSCAHYFSNEMRKALEVSLALPVGLETPRHYT